MKYLRFVFIVALITVSYYALNHKNKISYTTIKHMSNYDAIIKTASLAYNVPEPLIFAFIKTESNFNPNAYRYESRLDDASIGLMQVLLKTARSVSGNKNLTQEQLFDPENNIPIGTQYIAKQSSRYNGNINDIAAAYNAGSVFHKQDGSYVNQDYVDKINYWYDYYINNMPFNQTLIDAASIVDTTSSDITLQPDNALQNPIVLSIGAVIIFGVGYYAIKRYRK